MREVLRPMPPQKHNRCYCCAKRIPAGHASYALFDYDPRLRTLYIHFAHKGCAERAGLATHRNSPVSDSQVMAFWASWWERVLHKMDSGEYPEGYYMCI